MFPISNFQSRMFLAFHLPANPTWAVEAAAAIAG